METGTMGRTNQFTPVRLIGGKARAGDILPVCLNEHDGKSFKGQLAA